MKNFGILFTRKDTAELMEVPMPEPPAGEVRVKLAIDTISSGTERDDALAFLRLVALGRIDLAGFVRETHSPKECGEVYARLAKDGAFPVVQFNWEETK